MAAARPSPPKPLGAEITIVSAKNLKNVNWRHGDLKPYAVLYLEPDRRVATKPDDSGSIRPVWNERFTLSLPAPIHESFLTVEIFHSKPSETPKPLVGAIRSPLKDLIDPEIPAGGPTPIRTLELRRPSGRPQGKIRIKVSIQERPAPPDYVMPPPSGYYYSTTPPSSHPPPSVRDYRSYNPSTPPLLSRTYSPPPPPPLSYGPPLPQTSQYVYGNYSDPYSGYYSSGGYYSVPPAPVPARPYYDRASGHSGPSAPVDYSSGSSSYEQKPRGSKLGLGTGLAVGAVAGALGGLALEEGLKYEEDKIADRVEDDLAPRDDYSDYRRDY